MLIHLYFSSAIKEATKERDLDLLRKYLNGIKEQEDQLKNLAEKEGRLYTREEGISIHMEFELQEARKLLRDTKSRDKRRTAKKSQSTYCKLWFYHS